MSPILTSLSTERLALEPELQRERSPASEPPIANPASPTRDQRLAALVHAEFDNVWRALRRLGVPEAGTDDASQEVFIVAARKLSTIERGRERQYLYGIAVRVAANARRAHAAHREQFDEHALLTEPSSLPASDALLEEKQARLLLDRVLDALPHDLRTAFVLFEIEGFSLRELSELLDVPLGTVSSRLRRAREAFRHAAERVKRAWYHSGEST
ncbi:MAG TPA: sigma-70 family RNA polymerase sigma factor [Polyangiaceae bacterium]